MKIWPGDPDERAAMPGELAAADRPTGTPPQQRHLSSRADGPTTGDGPAA